MKPSQSNYSWKHDPLIWTYSILMLIPIIIVFIFYNYYDLVSCVCAGWMLLAFSIVIILLAGYEFRMKGGAPEGKSIVNTTVLVDTGVYAVIRHPQYLGFILFTFGLVLLSQYWLSVFSGVLGSALFYIDVLKEEQMSITKFGDEYLHYMQRVPRMNFILGIIKLLKESRK